MRERAHGGGSADAPRSAVLLVDTGACRGALSSLGGRLGEALPERWHVHATCLPDGDLAGVLERIVAEGCRELVVVPVQPHFSPLTTGQMVRTLHRVLLRHEDPLDLTVHSCWHDDAGYVSALARRVADIASARGLRPGDTDLRFVSPHAAAVVGVGPYRGQALRTAELVAERVGWPRGRVSVGAREEEPGAAEALICPLDPLGRSSPGDTVGEVGYPWAPLALFPPFVAALKSLILKGPRPVPAGRKPPEPLLPAAPRSRPPDGAASLVSIGVALEGGLGIGHGPGIRFSEPRAFARVKRTHTAWRAFLDWVREATPLREAFVWSTCQRTELYGWLPATDDGPDRARLVERIRHELFGTETEGLDVNVLEGLAAHHHLLRTACGLNSDLPGDRDVAAQLETACRRAQGAGTAGNLALKLVADAVALSGTVAAQTSWGRFATGYCAVALARVQEVCGRDLGCLRHVVIGGSTTSRSVLSALRAGHGVREHQVTAVYRDHHGQMKELRAAVGNGRRLRVHAYSEACVLQAMADADFVYFGIDQAEPVVEPGVIEGLRDFSVRPLTLVDFNSFGSLAVPPAVPGVSVWSAEELDHQVAVHAAITTTRDGFARAVEEAEAWIEGHLDRAGVPDGSGGPPAPS